MIVAAVVRPFSACFWHAALGVFSVLFYALAGAGTLFGRYLERRVGAREVDPELVRPLVDLRFRFDAAYFGVGTMLLLAAFLIGVAREGMAGPKAFTTAALLAYALAVPLVGRAVPFERRRRVVEAAFVAGAALALLNALVGNFVFTGFHDFL